MARILFALVLSVFAVAWGEALNLFFWSDDFVLLHYFRETSALDIVRDRLLHGPRSDVASPWWRPGWLLLFNAGYEAFGLTPWAHRLLLWSLHGVMLGAVFALARHCGARGVVAALLFALAPSYAEAILWVCAAYNVLPAALCLTLAAVAYAHFVESGRRGALALAWLGFLLSLLFREAGYHLPLVVMAAHLTLAPSVPIVKRLLRGGGHALAFLTVIALHHRYLSPELGAMTLAENFTQLALQSRHWVAQLFALPATDASTLGALGGLLALFAIAPARGRFALLWALAATFPFIARAHDTRFMYFLHAPLALAIVLIAQHWTGGRRPIEMVTALLLAGLGIANSSRIPTAIARARADADANAAFVELARTHGLHELADLHVDFLPPELFSGSGELLDLYLGKLPRVVNHALLDQRPPFLIYGNHVFAELPPETPMLHFDQTSRRYTVTARAALVADRVPVPLFGFRNSARVVASWSEVRHDPQVVHLLREPTPPLAREGEGTCSVKQVRGGTMSRIDVEIDAPRDAYLVIAFIGDLTDPAIGGRAFVDGVEVDLLTADGLFNAVPVRRGSRSVVLRTKL